MANLTISGDTSGSVTLFAPAIAGSTTLTLPNTTGTLALTSQVNNVTVTTYTSGSGNWTKPSTGTFAFVQMWSGGGSGGKSNSTAAGATASGGGGGGYVEALYLLSSLANTVAYSVGVGGTAITATNDTNGNAGGNSTFGSITVYGGAGGFSSGAGAGGGSWYGGAVGQGNPGAPWDGGTSTANSGQAARLQGLYGGGAGGSYNSLTASVGPGTSTFGGAGGAASNVSGATAGSGVEPAGGGGAKINGTTGSSGAGANGRIIIWTW